MPFPIAILWENEDAHEIDVTPTADVAAGKGFYEPQGRFVIPARDLASGQLSSARDNGIFRCRKQTASDVFSAGDTLEFSTSGVIAGSDPLTVVVASGAGQKYVFAELNQASGGGGGGLNTTQVNNLIDAATTRSFITSAAADDVPPVDADWPEGQAPQQNDVLWITRTPTTRRRDEFWIRNASVNSWTQQHVVTAPAGGGSSVPKRSEFVAIADIPAGTPINMNAATSSYTSAQDLDYILHDPGTAATFGAIYGRDLLAYVNGNKVEQADITRNDGDPAGRVRFNVIIPNGSEIVFESQVVT